MDGRISQHAQVGALMRLPLMSPRSPSPLHNVVANEAPTGEVGQEVFDTIGSNNLSVRFEITIVKVSLYCLGRFN